MKINSNVLKITGGAEILDELNPQREQQLLAQIQIYEISYRDNQDGTYDRIYKAKIIGEAQVAQGEKVIRIKDKTRTSVKNRFWAIKFLENNTSETDLEKGYQKLFQILRSDEELQAMLVKKYEEKNY